jgi:patatin-like phospholipase/acyl hydrolase
MENEINREQKTENTSQPREALRILSMDGGGIYGLFTVLMLKELCKRDKNFLKGNDVKLFSGTSAGALIALALASAENPRDIIMCGVLERFFNDARLYGKGQRPRNILPGLMGLTAWAGADGAKELFQEYFGNTTLSELKHNVLVSSFDLSGNVNHGEHQRWQPKMFYNFPPDAESKTIKVWEIAFGISSAVMWRPIMNGISDGGIFSDSPTINTIAKLLQYRRSWNASQSRPYAREENVTFSIDETLQDVRLLSLGVGNKVPHYERSNFNLGYLAFNMMPTNFKKKDYWAPIFYLLIDPQVEASNFEAKQFLDFRFHRLNPGVLTFPIPPVLAAMYLSRFDILRNGYIRHIYEGMDAELTRNEITRTVDWLHEHWRLNVDLPPVLGAGAFFPTLALGTLPDEPSVDGTEAAN